MRSMASAVLSSCALTLHLALGVGMESTIAQGGGAGGGSGEVYGPVLWNVDVHEVLPQGVSGFTRTDAVATFGIPFKQGAVAETTVRPRPKLYVDLPAQSFQFETLERWPDGSVKWALASIETDVSADQTVTFGIGKGGPGKSSGPNIASISGTSMRLDTGVLEALIDMPDATEQFMLFDAVQVDGDDLVGPNADEHGVRGLTVAGDELLPIPGSTSVWLEANGPTRAVVRADGTLGWDDGGTWVSVVDFTCRITARRSSRDLEIDFTVRNANDTRIAHAQVKSIELAAELELDVDPGNDVDVEISKHTASPWTDALEDTDDEAYLYVANCHGATTGGTGGLTDLGGGSLFYPHIPKLNMFGNCNNDPISDKDLAENGYRIQLLDGASNPTVDHIQAGSCSLNSVVNPEHGYLDVADVDGRGVSLAMWMMSRQWPASLEVKRTADSVVAVAGVFTRRKSIADYTFSWRQHESRTVVFSFNKTASQADPLDVAKRLDFPVSGRFASYNTYDKSGAFSYRLATIAQQNWVYEQIFGPGVRSVGTPSSNVAVTRFLYSGAGGGYNNRPEIEMALGAQWLRHGSGGDYINALDHALYKSEWQIARSDGHAYDEDDDDLVSNPALPHTQAQSDDSHRRREGIILAWHLTGDTRYLEALIDEAELLETVDIWAYTRPAVMILRAQALVYEFTKAIDPLNVGNTALLDKLRDNMDEFDGWVYTDPPNCASGPPGYFGWDTALAGDDSLPMQRRFYTYPNEGTNCDPKDRGFFISTLGPISLFHAARVLAQAEVDIPSMGYGASADAAHGRMLDLVHWTRTEIHVEGPVTISPNDEYRLVYSYLTQPNQATGVVDKWDGDPPHHPVLLGMTAGYEHYRDNPILQLPTLALDHAYNAIEQIKTMHEDDYGVEDFEHRLDGLHFFRTYYDELN